MYQHSLSLDIRKCKYTTIEQRKHYEIEFLDTNVQILNSNMLLTYIQICHGFIFVCDIAKTETINYLYTIIETVLNNCKEESKPKIFLYINNSKKNEKINNSNIQLCNQFIKKFNIDYYSKENVSNYFPHNDTNFTKFADLFDDKI